ncbi:MAG: 30S ribosomal protein S8 [Patescibacteria group bacterium]
MFYDLLAKINNAEKAGKETVTSRFSKVDLAVAKILVQEGYLKDARERSVGHHRFIEVKIAGNERKRVINGIKIISRPSRRIYLGHEKIKSVKQGYGVGVISTSKGVMSNKEARKQGVGGEYLFQIW